MPSIYRVTVFDRAGRTLRTTLIAAVTPAKARAEAFRVCALCGGVRFALEG